MEQLNGMTRLLLPQWMSTSMCACASRQKKFLSPYTRLYRCNDGMLKNSRQQKIDTISCLYIHKLCISFHCSIPSNKEYLIIWSSHFHIPEKYLIIISPILEYILSTLQMKHTYSRYTST